MRMRRWMPGLLALLLLLPACGEKDGPRDAVQRTGDTVYQPGYLEIAMSGEARYDGLADAGIGGDGFYLLGQGYDRSTGVWTDYPILRLPLDGGGLEKTPYEPAWDAIPEGAEGSVTPGGFSPCGDGGLWVWELAGHAYYELPQDFDPKTQNREDYRAGGGRTHLLRRIGPDGTEQRRIDVSALADRLGVESVYVNRELSPVSEGPLLDFLEDGAGNLYLLLAGKLCVLDENGAERFTLDWREEGGKLLPLGDGTAGVFHHPYLLSASGNAPSTVRAVDLGAHSTYDGKTPTSQGRDRLVTELVTGQVPDILDLDSVNGYALPFRQLAEKGYLEDLLPWIDGDPELKWEDLMEPLLKAAMAVQLDPAGAAGRHFHHAGGRYHLGVLPHKKPDPHLPDEPGQLCGLGDGRVLL